MTDAASAYFQRGDLADRAGDFGKAIELLSRVLAKKPDDPIARFNRALVNERMFLFRQAVADWEYYLRLDPNGAWAIEAKQHLSNLQQKLRAQESRATEPPPDPVIFFRQTDEPAEKISDARSNEDYLDTAIREWLPSVTSESSDHDDAEQTQSRLALSRLAENAK